MTQTINLREWDTIFLKDVEFLDDEMKITAESLKKQGIVDIIELKDGISITTNSYVGRIKIGDLQLNIDPKINGVPLYKLLNYAYGLKDLKLVSESEHLIDNFSFFEILIYELHSEISYLISRGAQRSYIRTEEDLMSPRGKIDIKKLCSQGGAMRGTLPCIYFDRQENNLLNMILLAGLKLSSKLVIDSKLKGEILRLSESLEDSIEDISLTRNNLRVAKNSINRLTERYSKPLELINILYESQGIQLEGKDNIKLKGYFFDMNSFFETLVGKLLANCSEGYYIKDQLSLHDLFIYTPGYNPRMRRSPKPRPDFALMKDDKVSKLLDAKYRDLWERNLPPNMLYQLSIYALSGVGDRTATIIYPSTDDTPTVQRIDINNPISNSHMGSVILKHINLIEVSNIIEDNTALTDFIDQLLK